MFHSLWLLALIIFPICNSTTDTLTPIQSLRGHETLISAGEDFALGFFSPGNSKNDYVGIWFNKIPERERTVVWVANRENPVQNSYGALLTIKGGNLVLIDGGQQRNNTLWSTNVSTFANISSATLTDSGNLMLRDDHERVLWESFDYPTNTHLPNMKLGLNLRTGLNRVLTSWKSPDDPAPGEFSLGLDRRGMPQFFLRQGSNPIWRSGPWVGERFSGVPVRNQYLAYTNRYVATDEEIYSVYNWNQTEKIIMSIVHDSGVYQWLLWSDKNGRWIPLYVNVRDRCDRYANCGAFGICDANSAAECTCLRGFEPRHPGDWNWRDWSGGCVRRKPLNCSGKGDDGFLKVESVKVPDTSSSRVEPSWSLKECEEECLKNCNCTAYATANISEGSGCVIWYGKLVDIKVYSELDQGQDLYTRVAASELDETSYRHSRSFRAKKKLLVTILIVISVVLSSYFCSHYWWKKAKGRKMNERQDTIFNDDDMPNDGKDSGLQLFNFGVILAATDNFSESNLLGKGGFGPVYKGELLTGQEIAVKRLSKNSGQGTEEFNNEVTLIAKLQHRNLVRLLGCCITGQERILVYEYMRNKSLDSLLFDPTRREMLNWEKRFNIIVGIARGILYLHEDSRFRIIHRDLKVSNILLDDNLNPKISDFGTARIFGGNQTQAKTRRVVGTYGYMSPEYAIGGLFSVKSDAFSFGVILLEIISGKRNNYCSDCQSMNLIGYVWELWKEDRVLELVDSSMSISDFQSEVLRCIQVGLLCVQGKPKDRPTMSSVVFMLGNETMMPSPMQPPPCFLKENCFDSQHSSSNRTRCCSKNEVTITKMEGR